MQLLQIRIQPTGSGILGHNISPQESAFHHISPAPWSHHSLHHVAACWEGLSWPAELRLTEAESSSWALDACLQTTNKPKIPLETRHLLSNPKKIELEPNLTLDIQHTSEKGKGWAASTANVVRVRRCLDSPKRREKNMECSVIHFLKFGLGCCFEAPAAPGACALGACALRLRCLLMEQVLEPNSPHHFGMLRPSVVRSWCWPKSAQRVKADGPSHRHLLGQNWKEQQGMPRAAASTHGPSQRANMARPRHPSPAIPAWFLEYLDALALTSPEKSTTADASAGPISSSIDVLYTAPAWESDDGNLAGSVPLRSFQPVGRS